MTDIEINEFIDTMGQIGDLWTKEQVQDVYGDYTLEDALAERQSLVDMNLNNLSALIK